MQTSFKRPASTPEAAPLILTPDHLDNALSSEEMSAYTGIRVHIVSHDDFPHSEELRKNGILPADLLQRRMIAVSAYLAQEKLSTILFKNLDIAKAYTAHVENDRHYIDISRLKVDSFGGWNPRQIERRYLLPAKGGASDLPDRWLVVPKPLNMSAASYLFRIFVITTEAVVLLDPRREEPQIFWSVYTALPQDRITNAPDTRVERLSGAFHEERHLIQILNCLGSNFFCEIDSDLYGRHMIRTQARALGIDAKKHLNEGLFARYASLLASSDIHQIAPAIEIFENPKKKWHGEAAIRNAIQDICVAVSEKDGIKKDARYEHELAIHDRVLKEPELVYTLLRRCLETGSFAHRPVARGIASQILPSVEYFSDGISRNPGILRKIYPVSPLPA